MGSVKQFGLFALVVLGCVVAGQTSAEPRLFSKVSTIPVPAGEGGISSVLPTATGLALVFDKKALGVFDTQKTRMLWKEALDGECRSIRVVGQTLVTEGDYLTGWSIANGTRLWSYPLQGQKVLGLWDDMALVAGFEPAFDQVMAIDLAAGTPLWRNWVFVPGPQQAKREGDEFLWIHASEGRVTRVRLATGRVMSGTANLSTAGDSRVLQRPSEWVFRKESGNSWLERDGDIVWLEEGTQGRVLNLQGEKLYLEVNGEVMVFQSRPLSAVVASCREAILSGREQGCLAALQLFSEAQGELVALYPALIARALRALREGDSDRWKEVARAKASLRQLPSLEPELRRKLAVEGALLAVALTKEGRFFEAADVVDVLQAGAPELRWRVLRFGVAVEQARSLLDAGKKALKKREDSQALELLDELAALPAIIAFLPEEVADASDGSRALRRAYKAVGKELPKAGTKAGNQSLCMAACSFEEMSCGDEPFCEVGKEECLAGCSL